MADLSKQVDTTNSLKRSHATPLANFFPLEASSVTLPASQMDSQRSELRDHRQLRQKGFRIRQLLLTSMFRTTFLNAFSLNGESLVDMYHWIRRPGR
jgi:hypothetical protein